MINIPDLTKKITTKENSENNVCEHHNEPKFNDDSSVRWEFKNKCRNCIKEELNLKALENRKRYDYDEIKDLNIPRKYTNKSYQETKENKKFMKYLKNINQDLIICGNPGTGKTHFVWQYLINAITKEKSYKTSVTVTSESDKIDYIAYYGIKCRYVEALKIIRNIKDNWITKDRIEQEIMDSFVHPAILVIDELGVQFGSQTEKQYLTEIINDRYNQQKTTILVANLSVIELTNLLGDRIIDRFRENGKVLVFDWPSYRGKSLDKSKQ